MILRNVGLMALLAGAAGLAQQPPTPPAPPQPVAEQPPRLTPLTPAERQRFNDIMARRARGEQIPEGDRRFAEEARARIQATDRDRLLRERLQPGIAPPPSTPPLPPQPPAPPLERALGGPSGRWWTRPEVAQRLGLTSDQTRRMDDIFQQHRLKLIDLNAVVQKEEAILEPLVSAEQPDEAKIVAQIDKVAQARAELEKANARMLLGIRRVLTQEQWEKLKSASAPQRIVGGMKTQPATAPPPPRPPR